MKGNKKQTYFFSYTEYYHSWRIMTLLMQTNGKLTENVKYLQKTRITKPELNDKVHLKILIWQR